MSSHATSNEDSIDALRPEFYQRLFDGAGLAIFACDLDGRIRAWNGVGRALFPAISRVEDAPPVRDLLPAGDRRTLDESFARCIETREPLEFRSRIRDGAGGATDFAVWLTPIFAEGGKELEGVTVWFHDITARMQFRRGLRKLERLASLGTLSGAVAHHYNNLLCSITTSIEYAMNMQTTAAMKRALQRTMEAVSRATSLTRQLLAFAQGDHRAADQADVTEVVLWYCDENERRIADRHVSLELVTQPIPVFPVPREHMLIILGNLVDNALDAMPEGGRLRITLEPAGGSQVRLTVQDSGPGISSELMEHLFEPFMTTKGELGGGGQRKSGMGLAVVYGLVNEMHGNINARNVPSGGALFEVILPITSATDAPAGACQ